MRIALAELIEYVYDDRACVCRQILEELPDWFGIPEAIDEYAAAMEGVEMMVAKRDGETAGFIALRATSDAAAEIVVMAVRPALHRRGIGRQLLAAAIDWAKEHARRYVTVKTLGASRADVHYERTRRFYESNGFTALEELHGLWPDNPCLLMIRPVGLTASRKEARLSGRAGATLRVARRGDLERLRNLWPSIFEKPSLWERFERALERDEVLVRDVAGDAVAFMWTQPHGFFGYPFISLLAVAPAHRRRGYATALIGTAVENAAGDRIFTSTNASNTAMQRLCEKNGWSRCGEVDALDEGDPEIVYVRRLRQR